MTQRETKRERERERETERDTERETEREREGAEGGRPRMETFPRCHRFHRSRQYLQPRVLFIIAGILGAIFAGVEGDGGNETDLISIGRRPPPSQ